MSIQVPGRGGTANPLEVLNMHLGNMVKLLTAQAMALDKIVKNTESKPGELVFPHVATVVRTESGAWAVFCLGCTHDTGDKDFVYPCHWASEDDSMWPPQLLMVVPESPEGHDGDGPVAPS